MTCFIAPLPGGTPEIFPIAVPAYRELERYGLEAMIEMLKTKPRGEQFIGSALRPDGTAYYLTVVAPKIEECISKPWKGAFFAPFGVGNICGTVTGSPTPQQITTLTVDAQLSVEGKKRVRASWSVIGSQKTTPNKAALIKSIRVAEPGPHKAEDIRRCLALHAPQRVFGEPRAIVSMQCGVAAACLIEALC